MRLIRFTGHELVELNTDRRRFPVWADADRVLAVVTNLHWETWAGRTYARPDGTMLRFAGGEHLVVTEDPETVAALLAGKEEP